MRLYIIVLAATLAWANALRRHCNRGDADPASTNDGATVMVTGCYESEPER